MSWVRAPHRTPNWKENDFDVVLFLFFPDEAGCAFRTGLLFGSGGKPLFWQLWHSLQAMLSHFWLCDTRCRQCSSHFGFVVLAAGNAFSFFGVVAFAAGNAFSFLALWHSVPERASYGTEYAFGAQNRLLGYVTHFQRHSVQKTGVSGTEGIFGAQNSLLWYATHHGYSVSAPPSGTEQDSLNRKRVSLALLRN